MKKLTKRVAALLSIGCAAFLGLFHTSCHLIGGVEYGTPYMEYDVKVKVQSPDGNPIEGIEVAVVRNYHTEEGDRIVKLVTLYKRIPRVLHKYHKRVISADREINFMCKPWMWTELRTAVGPPRWTRYLYSHQIYRVGNRRSVGAWVSSKRELP